MRKTAHSSRRQPHIGLPRRPGRIPERPLAHAHFFSCSKCSSKQTSGARGRGDTSTFSRMAVEGPYGWRTLPAWRLALSPTPLVLGGHCPQPLAAAGWPSLGPARRSDTFLRPGIERHSLRRRACSGSSLSGQVPAAGHWHGPDAAQVPVTVRSGQVRSGQVYYSAEG